MLRGHGGNIHDFAEKLGCAASDIIDMSSNVNPLGPPDGLVEIISRQCREDIAILPEVDSRHMIESFARRYGINARQVLAGNGTTQFIYTIPRVLNTKNALIVSPTYSDYADACQLNGVKFNYVNADPSNGFLIDIQRIEDAINGFDTVFICNPNNPTGTLIPSESLTLLCRSYPLIRFIIDESYLPFVINGEKQSLINSELSNVIVLNSMSKIFRIPGLRIGFLIASAEMIEKFLPYLLPWSVNGLAQRGVIYLMEHRLETDSFIEKTRRFLENERNAFTRMLQNISCIRLFPSTTSFILAELYKHTSDDICERLANERILIRNCKNFKGLSDRFIRISLKHYEINQMAAEKLIRILNQNLQNLNQNFQNERMKRINSDNSLIL